MTGSNSDPLEASLQRVVWSLRPYLADVIIVGGWVPYLYRAYGGFSSWGTRLSRTAEVDVLVPTEAQPDGRAEICELLSSAGFVADDSGSVWERDTTTGERIELLVGNTGPQASEGTPRPIDGQKGVMAIALDDLRLLGRYTRRLSVPMTTITEATSPLDIQVPLLGGYVLNKALTFPKRQHHLEAGVRTPNIKRGKDLVYIRDVLAGGPDVIAAVEADLSMMAKVDAIAGIRMANGAANLSGVLRDRPPETWDTAVRLLEEREGLDANVMAQDLAGYLTDAAEILTSSAAHR